MNVDDGSNQQNQAQASAKNVPDGNLAPNETQAPQELSQQAAPAASPTTHLANESPNNQPQSNPTLADHSNKSSGKLTDEIAPKNLQGTGAAFVPQKTQGAQTQTAPLEGKQQPSVQKTNKSEKKAKTILGKKGQTLKYAFAGILILVLGGGVSYLIMQRMEPTPTAPESLPRAVEPHPCLLEFTVGEEEVTPRSVSGQVYCQDEGGTKYPMPEVQMQIVRENYNGGNAFPTTDNNGNFQDIDLTGATSFSIQIQDIPDRELSNGQPYFAMRGTAIVPKDQCTFGHPSVYIDCDPNQALDHTGFDFRFINCEPPEEEEPFCSNLAVLSGGSPITDPQNIAKGSQINLICTAHDPDSTITHYQFRVLQYLDGSDEYREIKSSTQSDADWPHTFQDAGTYIAQCRICTSENENDCDDWEAVELGEIPTPTDPPDISLCDSCKCSGTGYETVTCDGHTVYVDCNANRCWSPTAGPMNWNDAVNYCSNLNYGGKNNWSLPSLNILAALCSSGSCSETCFGGDGVGGAYWSSMQEGANGAIYINFKDNNCNTNPYHQAQPFGVRCVR